jgi:hypothetical protein
MLILLKTFNLGNPITFNLFIIMNSTDKKLYELFSDKTLSQWCKVKIWDSEVNFIILWNPYKNNDDLWFWMEKEPISWESLYWTIYSGRQDIEILWHEPQLHDVFRVAEENWVVAVYGKSASTIRFIERKHPWMMNPTHQQSIEIPYNPTLPLLQQSENEYNEEWHLVKKWTKEQIISLMCFG